MSFPYVQSSVDLGPAQGPRLAMLWHMAEGGGTVAFLSKPNIRSVSVHFVIEYDGTIVQMLPLEHMHSSVNPNDIRNTDDPGEPGYGVTAARSVLGKWANTNRSLGPNHATIAVEVEGFAKVGPNTVQALAIARLAAYCGIPANLGHRDFQDYKPCPGRHFPWSVIGGHGHTEEEMTPLPITDQVPQMVTLKQPSTFYNVDGSVQSEGHLVPGSLVSPYRASNGTNHFRAIYAGPDPVRIVLVKPATITPMPEDGAHTVTLSIDGAPAYEVTV